MAACWGAFPQPGSGPTVSPLYLTENTPRPCVAPHFTDEDPGLQRRPPQELAVSSVQLHRLTREGRGHWGRPQRWPGGQGDLRGAQVTLADGGRSQYPGAGGRLCEGRDRCCPSAPASLSTGGSRLRLLPGAQPSLALLPSLASDPSHLARWAEK